VHGALSESVWHSALHLRWFGSPQVFPDLPVSPSVAVSSTSVAAGASVTATVSDVPTGTFWFALTKVGAPNTTYDKWVQVVPTAGSFVWNVTVPSYAGSYEIRLFAAPFEQLAVTPTITVAAPSQPSQATLYVSTSKAVPGSSVTVRLMAGPGGATDWLALARVSAADTVYLQWVYVGSGVTNRDWTVTMPTSADSYEFRLFLNNGYTRAATSAPVILTTSAPISGGSSSASYSYDAVGNRLSGDGSTYTIAGSSNRVTSISGALARSYSYDSSGNVTSDGTRTLSYNDAGRMTSVTKAGVATTYALNALGQRVKKTTSGTSTYFVYDEAGHLVGEYNSSGGRAQETVWLGDIPIATLRPNGGGVSVFYIHTDHLNAPRRISRASDNVIVWRWDSNPFGTTAVNEDPDTDSTLFVYSLRFPGQYFDVETGLHYNYMRDFDPQTGRYVESDPIGLRGGINTYAYVGGNPILLFDSLGLKVEMRCRSVGNPRSMSWKAIAAAMFGGEHCFLVVSCDSPKKIPETTISYPSTAAVTDRGYSNIEGHRSMTIFRRVASGRTGSHARHASSNNAS